MMIIDDIYMLYILLVSNAFLLGAAAIAVLRLESLIGKSRSFWNSPTGASIQDEANNQITEIVDQRFASLNRLINELSGKTGVSNPQKSGELPFGNAVRMAKRGASIDDLTRNCGLHKGEAQLMARVHANANQFSAPGAN